MIEHGNLLYTHFEGRVENYERPYLGGLILWLMSATLPLKKSHDLLLASTIFFDFL